LVIKSLKTRLLITSSSFRTTFGDKITKHLFFVHGEEKYAFFFGDKITKDSSFVYLFFFQDHFQSNALDHPLKTYLLLMGKKIYIFFLGDQITKDLSFVYPPFFVQDHFQSNALDPLLKTCLLLMGIFFFWVIKLLRTCLLFIPLFFVQDHFQSNALDRPLAVQFCANNPKTLLKAGMRGSFADKSYMALLWIYTTRLFCRCLGFLC